MGQVRDTAKQLYDSGALLGFAITSIEGDMVHNETFFSDDVAAQAVTILAGCVEQLAESERKVNRLTVELDDVIVIYTHVTDRNRHGMFILTPDCELDEAAKLVSELAA